MEVEEALESLGKVGRWQATYFIVMSVCKNTMTAFHTLSIIWISHTPEHHCRVSQGVSINDSIPRDSNGKLSQCLKYVNLSLSNQTMACDDGWTYDPHDSYTIVNQWDLVCEKEILALMPQTVLVVGGMIGAFFFSVISDKFGRKPVFLSSQIMMMFVGLGCVFIDNFHVFLVLRFLTGMLQQGIVLSGFILLTEIVPRKYRTCVGINTHIFWGIFCAILAFLAYLLPNWKHLQITISLFALFTLPFFWIIPESLPWLIANGKVEEAKKTIRFSAKMNKMKESDISSLMSKISFGEEVMIGKDNYTTKPPYQIHSQNSPTAYTLLDFFKSRRLLLNLIVSSFAWSVITLVYFGLTLTTGEMKGNRFMNGFYSGIVEIPALIVAYLLITRFGRKKPFSGLFFLSGISILVMPFTEELNVGGVKVTFLPVLFSNIGKFGITSCLGISYLYVAEMFPTKMRNQAIGISSFFGRIGNILATFTEYIMKRHYVLVCLVFALISFMAGSLILLLPETRNRCLPQSIGEVESWNRTMIPNANAANGINGKKNEPLLKEAIHRNELT